MSGIALRLATHAHFGTQACQLIDSHGTQTWITRAKNFVIVMSRVKAGSVLDRKNNSDESMVILPPGLNAKIETEEGSQQCSGDSLIILPPGSMHMEMQSAGWVVRIYSSNAVDLMSLASNAHVYSDYAPEVTNLVAWPQPAGGYRLRHYDLAKCKSPDPSVLKMRVFRSTNLMVNIFEPWLKPRDEHCLSPHWHDDFEQASLGLEGSFVHHIRYPWAADKTQWRPDEHVQHESPSVLIIPARAIHTSQNIGTAPTRLIDIFGPPRMDFSMRPGFVINADDYPMPMQS